MEKTLQKMDLSFHAVKETYYEELLALANKLIPDSAKAQKIVAENLEIIESKIDKYDSMAEVNSILQIVTLQDCDRYREYLQVQHEKAKQTHYNQLAFYLGFFVSKGKGHLIATQTFEQMKHSYFSYEEEKCTEAFIKITALKMCLQDMETDNLIT